MYRAYEEPSPLLIGYDPYRDLPKDHLARLVEAVVEQSVAIESESYCPGQPKFDPRLCVKILAYGYATGVRSSRQLEKHCRENLPYLYLTRGDTPSYRTICTARHEYGAELETVWVGLFAVAKSLGLNRLGRIVVDTSKLAANSSREMIVDEQEYAALKCELERILAEVEATDELEDRQGYAGETTTGKEMDNLQMREILRQVRKQMRKDGGSEQEVGADKSARPAQRSHVTGKMRRRISEAIGSIEEAECEGRKQVCLTDPDARMMYSGTEKKLKQCHSLEVAIDRDCGLLVAAGVTQVGADNQRLIPLVEGARSNEPDGIKWVDGDSGFFTAQALSELIEAGVDVCVPDSNAACELHRGLLVGRSARRHRVIFEYDEQKDLYKCTEGNELPLRWLKEGGTLKVYRAKRSCRGCSRYSECIVRQDGKPAQASYKQFGVRQSREQLRVAMERFNDPEHRQRYSERGSVVEGVFGFIREVIGFDKWLLRGSVGVKNEGLLMSLAYQLRRLYPTWAQAGA